MIESSLILRSLFSLWNLMVSICVESKILIAISKAFRKIGEISKQSFIVMSAVRISPLDSFWKKSFLRRGMVFVLDLPYVIVTWLGKKFGAFIGQSIIIQTVIKVHAFVGDHIHIVLGLFVMFMSVVPFTYWNNFYAFGGIMLMFAVTLFKQRKPLGTNIYLILFMLMSTLAFVFSVSPSLSLRFFVFYINAFVLLYVIIAELNTLKKFEVFINIVLFGVFLTGVYGIYQNFKGIPILPSQVDTSIDSNLVGRVYSTIGNANNYAELLVLFLPFFAASFMNAKKIHVKAIYVVMTIPCLISLLLTYSRSSWIGLVIAVGMFVLLKEWRLIPVVGVLSLMVFPFLPSSITNRVMTIFSGDSSTNMRFVIWTQTLPLIKDYWPSGIGLGPDVFIAMMKNYPTKQKAVHSHNIYIQILVETGFIGLFSFIALQIHLFKETVRVNLSKKIDMAYKNHIIAAISAVFGLLVVALVEYIWHEHRIMLAYWIVVGLLIASLRNANESARS